MILLVILFIAGYLCGSIPVAYIYCRLRGKDIRKEGSGNVGATNAARLFGKQAFFVILILDGLKGFLPVFACVHWMPLPLDLIPWAGVVCLSGTVTGHVWTCFLGFKGGKGVATSTGGLLAVMPLASLLTIGVFIGVFLRSKIVSLSSMFAAVFFALFSQVIPYPPLYRILSLALALFILYTHRSNIGRLRAGTETRVQWTWN